MVSGIATALPSLLASSPLPRTGRTERLDGVQLPSSPIDLQGPSQLKAGGIVALALAQEAIRQQEREQLGKAAEQLRAGQYEEARLTAMEFQKKNPTSASAAHIIGRAHMAEGDYEAAEEHLERAAALAPEYENIRTDLFNARVLQKSDEVVAKVADSLLRSPQTRVNGLRLYMALSERSPENADISLKLGNALDNAGGSVAALEAFEDALNNGGEETLLALEERLWKFVEDHPEAGVGFTLLGRTQQKLGKIGDAIASFERALAVAPEHRLYTSYLAEAHAEKGRQRLDAGDPAGALRSLELAKSLGNGTSEYNEDMAQAHLALGEKLISRGSTKQAFNQLVAARRLADEPETEKDLAGAFYSLGRQYQQAGDLEHAQLTFKYAYQLNDDQYTYRLRYAETTDAIGTERQADGDIAGAVKFFELAVELFPDTTRYQQHLDAAEALLG